MFLVESVQKDKYTEIHVFSRKDGVKKVDIIKDFKPYFYVQEGVTVPDDFRMHESDSGYLSIDNEKLKKIYVRKSSDLPLMKKKFAKSWEGDIMFPDRYIVDKIGEIDPYPLNILYFDIETNSHNEMSNIENTNHEITSICMTDSFTEEQVKLVLRSDKWLPVHNELLKNAGCIICETEEELLGKFINNFVRLDPDVISGWYIDGFDLQYIIRRMQQLEIDFKKLSPLNYVYINSDYNEVTIKGRIISDMIKDYKHFRKISNQPKAEAYSLEFTGQEVLGEGKIKHKETFSEMWKQHPDKLVEYNMKDTLLVKRINDKLKITNFFNQIRCKACSQYSSIYQASRLIDNLLLRMMKGKVCLPSKLYNARDTFDGALVILPKAGIYNNVLGVDVKGMYPNIIKTFNIGYETFNPKGEIKISEGLAFNKGTGYIAQAIIDLEQERNRFKKAKKESKTKDEWQINEFRQYAVKVLMNSIYGYLGFNRSRLYKKEIAAAVTFLGRKILTWTADVLKNLGYIIVYGDTDSVYVLSKKGKLVDMMQEGRHLVKLINDSYKTFAKEYGAETCSIEIEFEKIFGNLLFVAKKGETIGAKKKYAYRLRWVDGDKVDGKTKFTGFEVKRSDNSRIARDVQERVINMILDGESRVSTVEYLRLQEKNIRTGVVTDEDYGFPKEIRKDLYEYGKDKENEEGKIIRIGRPPVVAGALYSNKYLGTRFSKNSKPKWLYIKNVPEGYPETPVLSYEDIIPKGFIPDYKKNNERVFKMKLEQLFQSAGYGDFPNIDSSIVTMDNWCGGKK